MNPAYEAVAAAERARDAAQAVLEAARAKRSTILDESKAVFVAAGIDPADPGALDALAAKDRGKYEAVERYRAGYETADAEHRGALAAVETAEAEVLQARRALLTAAASAPGNEGPIVIPSFRKDPTPMLTSTGGRAVIETAALRAIEALPLRPSALDRLDRVVRDTRHDPLGVGAAYIGAVSQPDYLTAFGKVLANPSFAHLDMSPAELEAVRVVRQAMDMQAASLGYSTTGGFGVPSTLDPTIALTDDGGVSPLRDIARVVTISTNEWKGVSSDAVEATYEAEFTQVADGSPTLAQPTIVTDKAQAWIEFGVEVGQDWPGMQTELARLLAQGKANVEAVKFVNGAGHGSNEPEGIAAGLAVGSIIETIVTLDNLYAVQDALPAKYSPAARWLLDITTLNNISRLVASGDTTEPQIFSGDGTRLLRKPWSEVSTLAGVVIYGDIRDAFTIVDRVGMTVELVAHVFGTNHRPTGKRGLYAFWRNSSAIVNDNALVAISPGS